MAERRPQLTNDEDELMQMQEDFLAGRIQKSCVEVIKAPRPPKASDNSSPAELRKPSIFVQKRESTFKESQRSVNFEFPRAQVLKDVVEKCELPSTYEATSKTPAVSSFPEVFQLDKSKNMKASVSRSIFARQIRAKAEPRAEHMDSDESLTPAIIKSWECSQIARAVLGETEAAKIHQENLQKLASMSKEEIFSEREQLLSNLDPKIISFLKRKKTSSSVESVLPPAEAPAISPQGDERSKNDDVRVEEVGETVLELKKAKYLHMDVVEKEKVRWMAPLPPVAKIPETGEYFQARFDFEGRLLPANSDLPVTSALYSHGEEPERAGYSVNELMLLSRSSQLQQRVLALNTLAKVMERARLGEQDASFQAPLIPILLDSGMLLLLRFCLDDTSPTVISASLVAFSRLLTCPFDETCLERCLLWRRGDEQPDLSSRVHIDSTDREQEAEMKDDEVVKIDVVRACLRMDVHHRIRYVLEEMRLEARAVLAALEILTRIARSSEEASQALLDCPRLMNTLLRSFLPSTWASLSKAECRSDAMDNLYGQPVRQVLRLTRVMAAWSPALAARLTTEHPSLLEAVKLYVAIDTAQLNVPTQEGLLLVLDSYHFWRTLLRHGIGVQAFLDFMPAWFPQLLHYRSTISLTPTPSDGTRNDSNVRFSHQMGSAIFLMMEALLGVCEHSHTREPLDCSQVAGLREVVEQCVAKWSHQFRQLPPDPPEESSCGLLAAALNFLASFYAHWKDDPQAVTLLDQLCQTHVIPLLGCPGIAGLTSELIRHSNLVSNLRSCSRFPDSLPSVSPMAEGGELVPALSPPVPFPLPTAIFRLLRVWRTKSDSAKDMNFVLPAQLFSYLEQIGKSSSLLADNWYSRYELQFVHHLVMLSADLADGDSRSYPPERKAVIHQAVLTAISWLPRGEEAIAAEWVRRVIFNPDFLRVIAGEGIESALSKMYISQTTDHQALLDKAFIQLDKIAEMFTSWLFSSGMRTLAGVVRKNLTLLPADWVYLPLVALYQEGLEKLPPQTGQSSDSDSQVAVALCTLQAVYVLLSIRSAWFFRNMQPTEHFARLACIFLAGNGNLFFESDVASYLSPVMRGVASRPFDFSLPVRGVEDFLVFYEHLVEQFEAVSYGNALFGAFILLPLQQDQPLGFRLKLWCDHPDALRILTISEKQMMVPLEHWLEPIEEDVVLRTRYAAHLRSGIITAERNPVLCQIASHHQ